MIWGHIYVTAIYYNVIMTNFHGDICIPEISLSCRFAAQAIPLFWLRRNTCAFFPGEEGTWNWIVVCLFWFGNIVIKLGLVWHPVINYRKGVKTTTVICWKDIWELFSNVDMSCFCQFYRRCYSYANYNVIVMTL